ncbi:metallophosphoesterase [Comamonas terrigena]|uniref:metallophosphoesterase n=1 Tax=Comamonas terrigena TaxID=32013 RepID=UPI0023535ABB|nr:metallophosphoesterase [Comamonas terrigena]
MRIQLLSDLHLEVHPQFVPEPAADADVLVLAGDIGSYQDGSLLHDDCFGLERFSPLPQYAGWPCPVVFVPGNHEYDAQDWDAAHARLRRICDRLGLIWLERDTAVLDGVRFVGTTLWTDYDAIALLDDQVQAGDVGRLLKLRDKSFRAANFYLQKTGGTRHGEPFLAAPMREQALVCQEWLRTALAQHFDGPTVAVTHFAPSLRSSDPRYGMVPGTAGFCNALDDLLPCAQLWLHGHLHTPVDYTAQGLRADGSAWQCRVHANPLGYARKGEQDKFHPAQSLAL